MIFYLFDLVCDPRFKLALSLVACLTICNNYSNYSIYSGVTLRKSVREQDHIACDVVFLTIKYYVKTNELACYNILK